MPLAPTSLPAAPCCSPSWKRNGRSLYFPSAKLPSPWAFPMAPRAAETIPLDALPSSQVYCQITGLGFLKDLFRRANPNSTGKQTRAFCRPSVLTVFCWESHLLELIPQLRKASVFLDCVPSHPACTHPISRTAAAADFAQASVTLHCWPQPLSSSLPNRAVSTGAGRVRRSAGSAFECANPIYDIILGCYGNVRALLQTFSIPALGLLKGK